MLDTIFAIITVAGVVTWVLPGPTGDNSDKMLKICNVEAEGEQARHPADSKTLAWCARYKEAPKMGAKMERPVNE